jgi:hypothetical protein
MAREPSLDEIGGFRSASGQLLRLRKRSPYRIGGRRRIDADVRVIAGRTGPRLRRRGGTFRKDLYFRMAPSGRDARPARTPRTSVLAKALRPPKAVAPEVMDLRSATRGRQRGLGTSSSGPSHR